MGADFNCSLELSAASLVQPYHDGDTKWDGMLESFDMLQARTFFNLEFSAVGMKSVAYLPLFRRVLESVKDDLSEDGTCDNMGVRSLCQRVIDRLDEELKPQWVAAVSLYLEHDDADRPPPAAVVTAMSVLFPADGSDNANFDKAQAFAVVNLRAALIYSALRDITTDSEHYVHANFASLGDACTQLGAMDTSYTSVEDRVAFWSSLWCSLSLTDNLDSNAVQAAIEQATALVAGVMPSLPPRVNLILRQESQH